MSKSYGIAESVMIFKRLFTKRKALGRLLPPKDFSRKKTEFQVSPSHWELPITHYPLPITHYPLPIQQRQSYLLLFSL